MIEAVWQLQDFLDSGGWVLWGILLVTIVLWTQYLPMVRVLIALCPLLGLLGTVSGMIQVFDVMALSGNGNPRAMAAGVSRSTVPTMAGMVIAISGLFCLARLDQQSRRALQRLSDRLRHE